MCVREDTCNYLWIPAFSAVYNILFCLIPLQNMLQVSSSTAIAILASIAVVYFGITALCTIIICHVAR